MWIASSTSPPGGAGPSATSCGSIPRALRERGGEEEREQDQQAAEHFSANVIASSAAKQSDHAQRWIAFVDSASPG